MAEYLCGIVTDRRTRNQIGYSYLTATHSNLNCRSTAHGGQLTNHTYYRYGKAMRSATDINRSCFPLVVLETCDLVHFKVVLDGRFGPVPMSARLAKRLSRGVLDHALI